MRTRKRAYRAAVGDWQGSAGPTDAGDAAPCPQCGVFSYPLSWVQAWGVALPAAGVVVAARALRR